MNIFISFIKDALRELNYVFDVSSKFISNLILFIMPYLMFYFGIKLSGYSFIKICKEFWIFLLIPIVLYMIASFIKYYSNIIGKGDICPIPNKRFTEIDEESGMVSVENSRIQEMLLYVADIEDYLERKGYL